MFLRLNWVETEKNLKWSFFVKIVLSSFKHWTLSEIQFKQKNAKIANLTKRLSSFLKTALITCLMSPSATNVLQVSMVKQKMTVFQKTHQNKVWKRIKILTFNHTLKSLVLLQELQKTIKNWHVSVMINLIKNVLRNHLRSRSVANQC